MKNKNYFFNLDYYFDSILEADQLITFCSEKNMFYSWKLFGWAEKIHS